MNLDLEPQDPNGLASIEEWSHNHKEEHDGQNQSVPAPWLPLIDALPHTLQASERPMV